MSTSTYIKAISSKLKDLPKGQSLIPGQRGKPFSAQWTEKGVQVDNLRGQSLIPWELFGHIENFLISQPSQCAPRGNAMNARLGDPKLPIDSIEGQMAIFYNKKPGDSVFRRISPVANLLVWAGVCRHTRGGLCHQR